MQKDELIQALENLGLRLQDPLEITIAGGSALILVYGLSRGTMDIDAILSRPPMDDHVKLAIRETAENFNLSNDWLNDSVKGFLHVLPKGFLDRRVHFGAYSHLNVFALHRCDLILMKLYAMRAEDIEDLHQLKPNHEEIAFVRDSLEHVAKSRPDKAHHIELYLNQREK